MYFKKLKTMTQANRNTLLYFIWLTFFLLNKITYKLHNFPSGASLLPFPGPERKPVLLPSSWTPTFFFSKYKFCRRRRLGVPRKGKARKEKVLFKEKKRKEARWKYNYIVPRISYTNDYKEKSAFFFLEREQVYQNWLLCVF